MDKKIGVYKQYFVWLVIDNWYIYLLYWLIYMQKKELRNYTGSVSMDVLTEEWFYVSLGLCVVCCVLIACGCLCIACCV